jgi:hypothetical protein
LLDFDKDLSTCAIAQNMYQKVGNYGMELDAVDLTPKRRIKSRSDQK